MASFALCRTSATARTIEPLHQVLMTDANDSPLSEDSTVRTGWVAMLDILGWKGLWRRHGSRDLVARVQQLRGALTKMGDGTNELFSPKATMRMETAFLSDTLVVATWAPNRGSPGSPPPMMFLSVSVARLLRAAALGPIPLNFRGTITEGEFLITDNIILGPAIDEAAGLMNTADAAITWFGPSVRPDSKHVSHPFHFEYPIPMKNGEHRTARVVNPFTAGAPASSHQPVHDGMLRAFGEDRSSSVEAKLRNTVAFLDDARDVLRCHFDPRAGSSSG